jgi:hypothetical protein
MTVDAETERRGQLLKDARYGAYARSHQRNPYDQLAHDTREWGPRDYGQPFTLWTRRRWREWAAEQRVDPANPTDAQRDAFTHYLVSRWPIGPANQHKPAPAPKQAALF